MGTQESGRLIRAIYIDARLGMAVERRIAPSLVDVYALIGCRTVACIKPPLLAGPDVAYVDDEGLFEAKAGEAVFWTLGEGNHQPYVGSAVIVGTDEHGEDVDAETPLTDVVAGLIFARPLLNVGGSIVYERAHRGKPAWCGFDEGQGRFRAIKMGGRA